MCGIWGIGVNSCSALPKDSYLKILQELYIASSRRGSDASGYAIVHDDNIEVFKDSKLPKTIAKSRDFKKRIKSFLGSESNKPKIVFGHDRLATNGSEYCNTNNHPACTSNSICVHNGIVVNVDDLWSKYPALNRTLELDSEIIPELLNHFTSDLGLNVGSAISRLFHEAYGEISAVVILKNYNKAILFSNNGSLYFASSYSKDFFIFASEHSFLRKVIKKNSFQHLVDLKAISQLTSDNYILIDLSSGLCQFKNIKNTIYLERKPKPFNIVNLWREKRSLSDAHSSNISESKHAIAHFNECEKRVLLLERCRKCLLPNTFPFIQFNSQGVCNYCLNYKTVSMKDFEQLKQEINPLVKNMGNKSNVLIGLSGGRDSCYSLHIAKKELNLRPVAFSYDWGMITDLARRNQSRLCAKLKVEHIVISANIKKKREFIRKNVLAWLKKPHLGLIPLFMAGDKQYFYYSNKLMREYNIKVALFGENHLETTFFKYGFCGIKPNFGRKKSFSISVNAKIQMVGFYLGNYIANPAYINSSLLDTFGAYWSFYLEKHPYFNLYDYLIWDEQKILKTLKDDYDWEISHDTTSSWRIGDGTAAFYNYIYYIVAGFTENDTFRSNQIREGLITREKAFELSIKENQPRWDSIKWYIDTIGLEFEPVIERINNISKFY